MVRSFSPSVTKATWDPQGGIDIDVPAGNRIGITFSQPQNFVSFYWASTGPDNTVSFPGGSNPSQFLFVANGCDLAPACGNPLDRYITFDFSNLGGANVVEFRAFNENEDFHVLNFSGAVPEPSTWAMMLIGFAGLGFAFRHSRRKVSMAN